MTGRRRRRWAAAVVATVVSLTTAMVLALAVSPSFRATSTGWLVATFLTRGGVEPHALDPAPRQHATVWLIVGSDDREGLSGGAPQTGDIAGERADAMALVAVDHAGSPSAKVIRLPRELLVETDLYGRQRLGALLDHGAAALIDGVRVATGLPVHHYIELEMAALVEVVDALGGIEMYSRRPARDRQSGLDLPIGPQRLDGDEALAYVRSRTYEEYDAHGWHFTEAGDLARITRQQELILALAKCIQLANPRQLLRAVRAIAAHLTVDGSASPQELGRLIATLRAGAWSSGILAVRRAVPEAEVLSPFPPIHRGSFPGFVADEPAAAEQLAALETSS